MLVKFSLKKENFLKLWQFFFFLNRKLWHNIPFYFMRLKFCEIFSQFFLYKKLVSSPPLIPHYAKSHLNHELIFSWLMIIALASCSIEGLFRLSGSGHRFYHNSSFPLHLFQIADCKHLQSSHSSTSPTDSPNVKDVWTMSQPMNHHVGKTLVILICVRWYDPIISSQSFLLMKCSQRS